MIMYPFMISFSPGFGVRRRDSLPRFMPLFKTKDSRTHEVQRQRKHLVRSISVHRSRNKYREGQAMDSRCRLISRSLKTCNKLPLRLTLDTRIGASDSKFHLSCLVRCALVSRCSSPSYIQTMWRFSADCIYSRFSRLDFRKTKNRQ